MKLSCDNCMFAIRDSYSNEVVDCCGDCEFARLVMLESICNTDCTKCSYVVMGYFGDEYVPCGCRKDG